MNRFFLIEGNTIEIHFDEKPQLRNPVMVAAWPGMGMLAKISADFLIQQLNAKQFAEILSPGNDIYFKDGVGKLSLNKHSFYYWRGEQADLIICSGANQPQSLDAIHQLANLVVDLAKEFNVKRIYTFAAFPHPEEENPRVFGVVNKPELKKFLVEKSVTLVSGEGRITGLNGLLISIAQQKGIEGICFLCNIRYLDIPQPRSAQTVLRTLSKILGINLDLSDLEHQALELEEKIKKIKEHRTPKEVKTRETRYIS